MTRSRSARPPSRKARPEGTFQPPRDHGVPTDAGDGSPPGRQDATRRTAGCSQSGAESRSPRWARCSESALWPARRSHGSARSRRPRRRSRTATPATATAASHRPWIRRATATAATPATPTTRATAAGTRSRAPAASRTRAATTSTDAPEGARPRGGPPTLRAHARPPRSATPARRTAHERNRRPTCVRGPHARCACCRRSTYELLHPQRRARARRRRTLDCRCSRGSGLPRRLQPSLAARYTVDIGKLPGNGAGLLDAATNSPSLTVCDGGDDVVVYANSTDGGVDVADGVVDVIVM